MFSVVLECFCIEYLVVKYPLGLVVGLLLDPASRVVPQDPLTDFVEDKDEDGEGHTREPPVDLQWVHLQALVHARSVRQESRKHRLKDQTKVHDPVIHSLLED